MTTFEEDFLEEFKKELHTVEQMYIHDATLIFKYPTIREAIQEANEALESSESLEIYLAMIKLKEITQSDD